MSRDDFDAVGAERELWAFAIGVTLFWCVFAVATFLRDAGVLA